MFVLEKIVIQELLVENIMDMLLERQKLKDYFNDQIKNHGLSGCSGANFKDSISPNGKVKYKQNTTVEEYVNSMSDAMVVDFNGMNDAFDKGLSITVRESMYFSEFVPDLRKMRKQEEYSLYQVHQILDYAIQLEAELGKFVERL